QHQIVAGLRVPEEITKQIRADIARQAQPGSFEGALGQALIPLGNVRALSLVVDADTETTAKVQLTFPDEAGATRAYWPARDGMALLRLLITPLRVRLRGEKGVAGFLPMLNKVEQGLRTAGVKRENNILEVALRIKGNLEDLVGSARATLVAVEQMR